MVKLGVSLTGIGQQPQGVDMQQSFREIVEYVRAARDLGFDFIYQGQHYLTSPYQQLQTMPLLARLSAETGDMGIVATLLTPLHHPVDLAERVATMDVITGGNFTLAAALGYRDEEYDAFQVERRQRFHARWNAWRLCAACGPRMKSRSGAGTSPWTTPAWR